MPKTAKQPPQSEPDGQTTGMLHRRPGKDCPLCPLWGIPWDDDDPTTWNKQHVHAAALWEDWDPSDKGGRWIANVIDTAKDLGVEVTPEQVKVHFSDRHKIEQPMLTGSLNHDHLLALANGFSDEGKAVINAIYRQHVLMTRQIVDVFYGRGRSLNGARQAALGELSPLAQAHFLYRYYPSDDDAARKNPPPQFSKSAIWYLGRAAIPYIKERYGLNFYPPHITRAREVKSETMIHDLKANGIFSSICATLNEAKGKIPYQDSEILLEALPANWYGPGPQALNMAFLDRQTAQERRIMPDGFASLSVHRSGDISNCQLPFFYEFDNGTRDPKDVAGQLLAYHLLALSGVATKRFPDLDVDQYALPVLMVFSDKGRAKKISRLFRERAQTELGIENGAPIFIATEKEWNNAPFAGDAVKQAWDDSGAGYSFLDLLINASKPLIEAKNVSAEQVLQLDTTAGGAVQGGTAPSTASPSALPPATAAATAMSKSSIEQGDTIKENAESTSTDEASVAKTINDAKPSSETIRDTSDDMPETMTSAMVDEENENLGLADSDTADPDRMAPTVETAAEVTNQELVPVSDYTPVSKASGTTVERLAQEIMATRQYLQQLEEQQRELLGYEEIVEPEQPFALPAGAAPEEAPGAPPELEAPAVGDPTEVMASSDPTDPFSPGANQDHQEEEMQPQQTAIPFTEAQPVAQPQPVAQAQPQPAPIAAPSSAAAQSDQHQTATDDEYTPAWEALEEQSPSQASETQSQPLAMPSQPAPMPEEPTRASTSTAQTEMAPAPASFPSLEDELGWEEATSDSPPPPLPLPDAASTDQQQITPPQQFQPDPGDAPLVPDYQHAPPVSQDDPLQQQSLQHLPEMPSAPEPSAPKLDYDEEAMLPADSPLRTSAPQPTGELPHVAGPVEAQELPPPPISAIPSEPIPPAYASDPTPARSQQPPVPAAPSPEPVPEDDPLADLPPLPGPGSQSIFADDEEPDDQSDQEESQSLSQQQEIVNPLPVSADPIQEADTVSVGSVEDRLNNTAAARRAKRARRSKS